MILLLSIGAAPGIGHSADCMDRFPEGRFGISLSHPAAAGVVRAGFTPLYLVKQSVTISRPEDCQYVYTHDVFRLTGTRTAGALLAGCVGDFDGDGRLDVALLMKRQRDGVVVPVVFKSAGAQYQVTEIEGITDPYGFAEDPSVWPGPFCTPRPPSGVFKSGVGEGKVDVVGDLFTIGWKTYFWNPTADRFEGILTND